MLSFFVRGLKLKGSLTGITYLFTPEMKTLLQFQPWFDAASQVFFSLGIGFGSLPTFASYSPKHNNIYRDAILVGCANVIAAIFGSAVTFCIVGFKATVTYERCLDHNIDLLEGICSNGSLSGAICHGHNVSVPITRQIFEQEFMDRIPEFENLTLPDQTFRYCNLQDDLNEVVEGPGLVFMVYTQAINEFGPSAPFWSVVFFLMLLSMGIGALLGTLECGISALYDLSLSPWLKNRWVICGMLCATCCCIGLLFVQESGYYWFVLFDSFLVFYPLVLIAFLQCIAVAWVFGVNRFADEIQWMIGFRPNIAHMQDATYSWFAILACTVLVLCCILWIPGVALGRKLGLLGHFCAAEKLIEDRPTWADSTSTILD
ncbi:transporter [Plakobranchus ocellatus]|uniref:Transporter n=1 Tax=Plakobranchus ocellatus TaxID=259542 RepID=A0AAV4DJE3_9GAST|nr:transporter [Plakobranchus ocellatus]